MAGKLPCTLGETGYEEVNLGKDSIEYFYISL